MNILLIMPLSYGYYKSIIKDLRSKGHSVTFVPDFDESFSKRALRKFCSINKFQKYYIKKEVNKLGLLDDEVHLVLLIRGYSFSQEVILWLKRKYQNARMVMYQWDPVSVSKSTKQLVLN